MSKGVDLLRQYPDTFVVTEACVDCMYSDCVTVCPVSCFYKDDRQLVIDPDVCIVCGACVAPCPVNAIFPVTVLPEEKAAQLVEHNYERTQVLKKEGKMIKDRVPSMISQIKDPSPELKEKCKPKIPLADMTSVWG